jgi:18S rRNA (guanine1575-N7)-methyltransferase
MPNKNPDLPKALTFENENEKETAEFSNKRVTTYRKKERVPFKSKEWILTKKDVLRKKGVNVKNDSKYTGRKRKKL